MICDFVCNMCGKQFKSQKTHTQHNRDVHIEEHIPCSLCDKTFRTKKHLANHKLSKHTEKESLQCDVKSDDTECSYNTTSVGNLKAHKKRVHENTVNAIQQLLFKFACSSCDFKTGKKYNLERHSVTCKKSMESLPSENSCKQCRKAFSSQKALKRHTKVHNKGNVPNTTVSCIVCQKTFAKSWNLKRHQQDAHGLTEKGNTVQNSAGIAVFTTEALVKETVAEKIPADAISVQCNQCNYKARTRWLLKRHKQLKHLGIVRPESRGRKRKLVAEWAK